MDERKRKALAKLGGRITTVSEFLDLTAAEEALIEMRLQLVQEIRELRKSSGVTQEKLASAIGSTQSRVAKMEGGDPQASIESLLRAVVALGGRPVLKLDTPKERIPEPRRMRRAAPASADRKRPGAHAATRAASGPR